MARTKPNRRFVADFGQMTISMNGSKPIDLTRATPQQRWDLMVEGVKRLTDGDTNPESFWEWGEQFITGLTADERIKAQDDALWMKATVAALEVLLPVEGDETAERAWHIVAGWDIDQLARARRDSAVVAEYQRICGVQDGVLDSLIGKKNA